MKYVKLQGIEQKASRLVYGTGIEKIMGTDREAAFYCLDLAWEAGFRTFDTAYTYGNAEKNLGDWMDRRGYREQIVLLDKGCNPGQKGFDDVFSGETIRQQLTESLDRLKTTWTDLYILHRDDETKPVDEIVEVLNEYREKGLIRRFGGSNWKKYRIEEANRYAAAHGLTGFSAVSPSFSLVEPASDPWGGSVSLAGASGRKYRQWLSDNQIPVFSYSSLARGYLSGKFRTDGEKPIEECLSPVPIMEYDCPENRRRLAKAEQLADRRGCTVPQVCLAWMLAQKMNLFPIISPSAREHMADNLAAFDITLTDGELAFLE